MASRSAAVPPSAAPLGDDGALYADELKARLVRLLGAADYRPPLLPGVALEVMQLSHRPNAQFEEVVKVLERDPVLAARVLAVSNSVLYSARSPIRTLHQAAVRLGLRSLRDLVLEAALHVRIFRVAGYDQPMARLARHSTATAHVVRVVCRRTLVDSEYAFLCGLLHDVGFAACLLALAEDERWRSAQFSELAPAIDEVHEEASGLLMRAWKLPEPIREVVATHHHLGGSGGARPVNAALIVAEQLAWEADAGMMPPPENANPMSLETPEPPLDGIDVNWTGLVEEALKALRMDALALGAARAEAFEIVRRLGANSGGSPPA